MSRRHARTSIARSVLTLAFLAMPAIAQAQSLQSTADLRNACQQAANNTITLQENTKISLGARPFEREAVNCGCTVIIPPGLKLEFENVGMTFAGGLTLRSAGSAEVRLQNSSIHATSIGVSLLGKGSIFSIDQGQMAANAGDFSVAFGEEGLLMTRFRLVPGEGYSVRSSGMVRINGGAKLNVDMDGSHVEATRGFSLVMGGVDGLMKLNTMRILAPAGGISIAAASEKATLDFSWCWLVAREQIKVALTGAQSKLSMNVTNLIREDTKAAPASVLVEVTGAEGSIEAKQVGLQNVNSFITMRTGTRGSTKAENVGGYLLGALQILSGAQGTTEVKNSNLISSTQVRIATGAGGSCSSSDNIFTAPTVQACQ